MYILEKLNKAGPKSAKRFDSKNAVLRKGKSERKTAKNSYNRNSSTALQTTIFVLRRLFAESLDQETLNL